MSVNLSQFLPAFLEESNEGLELIESGLLNLQSADEDSIHSIFRAAHSIKGGAGTFGFKQVTEFTHLVETLLDEMRDGRRDILDSDVEILLESVDCMRLLLEADREGVQCEDDKIARVTGLLNQSLKIEPEQIQNSVDDAKNSDNPDSGKTTWLIKFVPEHHLVQTGNDPIFLFNALTDLGEVKLTCSTEQLPGLNDICPEELYLSWDIELTTQSPEEDIREIFEWVEDECELDIAKQPTCLLYTSPSPRDGLLSRMPSSA